ncbi:hypothetical protein EC253486_2397 [Escherichia coli 2534-86]|nr:hypothetical protein EC253486_2397 [Escherichia coli 2534-86]
MPAKQTINRAKCFVQCEILSKLIVAVAQSKNAVSGKWVALASVNHDSSFFNQPGAY